MSDEVKTLRLYDIDEGETNGYLGTITLPKSEFLRMTAMRDLEVGFIEVEPVVACATVEDVVAWIKFGTTPQETRNSNALQACSGILDDFVLQDRIHGALNK